MALGAVASAVQAGLPALPLMLALRVVEGVSHLAIVVAGPVLIAGLAGERHRGLAMALWSSFFGLTYAVLALLAPPVLAAGGVAGLFLGHALWMAGLALVLAQVLPADPPPGPAPARAGPWALHAAIYRDPRVAAPALGFVWYTASYVALLTLLPPLLPPAWQAPVAAAMPLVSIAASLTLGVWAVSRWEADRVVQAGHALSALGALGFALAPGQGAAMASGAMLIALGAGLAQGASFAAIPALNPAPADRARAAGAIAQMGNLGTVTGTPLLAALLAVLGPGAVAVFVVPLAVAGIAVIGWLRRRRG
jgi:MFS family permease